MPQLSLYLDDETMFELREDAAQAGMSLSKFTAKALKERKQNSSWPQGYFEEVCGSMADATWLEDASEPLFDADDILPLDQEVAKEVER